MWAMIEAGLTADQMATALADNYDIAKETIRAEIQSFCGKLVDEDVLIASKVDTVADTAEFSDFRPKFEPASISKYDDLVDSFALDPPLVIGSI
ncbi:PqqD family protein [Parasedimentitalea psychrophila]|uniref:PqqD family protein n=1 Tax=Parasedimentitalea psychrophila TaxID=2997337 RepID=A0A9Y2P371_9RHOB|nr:PqqD family protein [Parasedimentitalea psychrophila]WIY25757.1 PqqD family protein [Parasedimentitalea psychrophila]